MCRNVTLLRGLEPPATDDEVEAAARQYVRKVSGITHPSRVTAEAFEHAVAAITVLTRKLLEELPERQKPATVLPPLRRPEVQARIAAREAARAASATG
ncbi:DUF2277 domain-containing protein [Litorihabitans aurantiacus]|nr:DUF2277 domain-containing protein [Litorihabitans aurantiacus]